MALETKLVQKLGQSLLMTPQLQQAIKLLQLGRLEYIDAIQKELLENPILEEQREEEQPSSERERPSPEQQAADGVPTNESSAEPETQSPAEESVKQKDDTPVDWEHYLESFQDAKGASTPKGTYDFEDRPSLEATLTKTESLRDHLLEQIRMIELDETATHILMEVIGNLNKDGYFCGTYEEVVKACNCTEAQVEEAMEELKSLDPPGIGARDLRECLLFQLEAHGRKDSLTYKVTSEHLGLLEKRKYDQIAKIESVAVEQVYAAITEIQSLDPRPASRFADDTIRYIIPDIYVYRDKNDYVVSLNEDGMPKLRVSPYYLDVLRNGDKDSSRAYLNERFKAASWLIKSIHQRQQTIYRVTQSIVKFQREFFDHGIHRLKPLVLKDVADDIEMHESTVSRVTTNKYVHTPQGVFELKFFFTTGISSGSGEVSSSAIKERIRQIIAAEPPKKPISDQAIVDALAEESVKIARRTVAKYRESLGILSSSKRKKLF